MLVQVQRTIASHGKHFRPADIEDVLQRVVLLDTRTYKPVLLPKLRELLKTLRTTPKQHCMFCAEDASLNTEKTGFCNLQRHKYAEMTVPDLRALPFFHDTFSVLHSQACLTLHFHWRSS